MTLATQAPTEPDRAGYKVDISRGQRIGRVSSEWFTRPDDERYLSLETLYDAVRARAEAATTQTVETRSIRVEAAADDAERLQLMLPDRPHAIAPTHWSFGQLCSLVGAPSGYLRQLPAALAGINLQHGLLSHRGELVKTLESGDGHTELRGVTGPDYGRIWDQELVSAVMKTRIAFTGGTDVEDHRAIWDVLDRTRSRHPDMILLHGATPSGAERAAACWADTRGVTQVAFRPDWNKHGKAAPFRRNDRMIEALPTGIIIFPGSGIQDNLADKARKLGIPLWDFRKIGC